MLARTPHSLVYLSAEELGITARERAGLIEVRDDLASGRVKHVPVHTYADGEDIRWDDAQFNMSNYHTTSYCGTAHCIAGFMQAKGVYDRGFGINLAGAYSRSLRWLFEPGSIYYIWEKLTPAQAVRAIDHFLSGAGSECWPMALADIPLA